MAAPLKPWERIGVNLNSIQVPPENQLQNPTGYIIPEKGRYSGIQGGTLPTPGQNQNQHRNMTSSGAPPLPPRPSQQNTVNRFGAYSAPGFSGYSPYSYGGGFGGYGGYGMYSGGFNRLGPTTMGPYGAAPDNFWQMAEESSRPAFQSIESIVQAFGSISMMLESTFNAVYSSFRAVVGVAEHFSRLKIQLTSMVSVLAIIRTIRWLYRRLLHLLGIRNLDISEDTWNQAAQQMESNGLLTEADLKKARSSWPIIMFFGVVLGTPWLIWKILQSVTCIGQKDCDKWMTGDDDHFVAAGQFDFTTTNEREVPFRAGQEIRLAPKHLQPQLSGWLLGSVDGKKVGLVPANYIKILGKRRGTKNVQVVQPMAVTETQVPASISEPELEKVFSGSSSDV